MKPEKSLPLPKTWHLYVICGACWVICLAVLTLIVEILMLLVENHP